MVSLFLSCWTRSQQKRNLVEPPLFTTDDDVLPNAFERPADSGTQQGMESTTLLSVDELLNSVPEHSLTIIRLNCFATTSRMMHQICCGQVQQTFLTHCTEPNICFVASAIS
ncbi:uncharacterized protein LOC142628198 [Castanea sativa]|uniref:uncharacterized protein LOC142628198 n=1 Tax=Castanea sativa TaxID=21020 RepID=UPI003F6542F8